MIALTGITLAVLGVKFAIVIITLRVLPALWHS